MSENTYASGNLRSAYLHWLIDQLGAVPLADLRGAAGCDLAALFIPRLTRRPEAAPSGGERTEHVARWLPLMEGLNAEKHVTVLGGPGAGKSALLDFTALCLAGENAGHPQANLAALTAEARWEHGALLPARVTLREFSTHLLLLPNQPATGERLWNYIVSTLPQTLLNFAPALRQEWVEQGGVLLLDGLDEVPESRREAVKAAVQNFAAMQPKMRVIATCRTAAYQDPARKLSGFAEVSLQPFLPEQIQLFIERWTALTGTTHASTGPATFREPLGEIIAGNGRLSHLAQQPLALTLLAAVYTWGGGALPDRLEELYAAATQLLFEQWAGRSQSADADPEGRPMSLLERLNADRRDVREQVCRLAFEALDNRETLHGRIELNLEQLSAALLKLNRNPKAQPAQLAGDLRARRGLIRISDNGLAAFPHRLFQDYLAACHLTDEDFPDALARRLRADPDHWREVAQLAGAKAARGMASAAWLLAEALCPPQTEITAADGWGALVAAQVLIDAQPGRLAEPPDHRRPTLERMRAALIYRLSQGRFSPADAVVVGEVLAAIGDTRFRAEAWHLPDDDTLGFIEIPAGPFVMGSDRQHDSAAGDGELPQHEVSVPRYFIAKYPVTVAQFRAFVQASGYEPRDKRCLLGQSNHPVTQVTLHDTVKYCEWLTETLKSWEGAPEAVARLVRGLGWQVSLPSEAEWEKAARGAQGQIFPWGDAANPNAANYAEAGVGETTAVGCYPAGASPYGCLDMAGNVWEWTRSAHKLYPYDPRDGREDLRGISFLVMRGGGFDDQPVNLRCACRSWFYLAGHFKDGGFRVALSSAKM